MTAHLTDSGWRDQAGNALPVSDDPNISISFHHIEGAAPTQPSAWSEEAIARFFSPDRPRSVFG